MFKLEPRPQASRLWTYGSPLLALAVTVIIGIALFMALGKDPVRGLQVFFWEPIKSQYALGELMVKATPLLLIALGLAVCFRSNVWNIGAEGQFVIGAVVAGGVALLADKTTGPWIVPAILLAGVLGGMAWAGLTALLRDKFNANEILVSLMLVYVATLVLGYLVYGPWKDPMGYNFPQTKTFEKVTQIPRLMQGSRVSIGLLLALAGAAALWVFLFRTRAGFAQQVGGLAPAAARYAGFSSRRALWTALLISGGAAGLAGAGAECRRQPAAGTAECRRGVRGGRHGAAGAGSLDRRPGWHACQPHRAHPGAVQQDLLSGRSRSPGGRGLRVRQGFREVAQSAPSAGPEVAALAGDVHSHGAP